MSAFTITLLVGYLVVITVICVYGAHRYWLVLLFARQADRPLEPETRFEELPTITVQLPMFNEAAVASRIIEAACRFDYPADRLQVQVLDDSTDESVEIAREAVDRMRRAGHDVELLHRDNREGFKAGALAAGLETARGELIAVFDADFIPPPDLLRAIVDHFTDDEVGMVQTRWEHLNRSDSMLTEIQAMFLDGHFVVEQSVRAEAGRWFNFNGTAGMWRRTCIDDAGGWQHDTLTEDTDLSYRAQLRGWRFVYRSDVVCPAEIPPTTAALVGQQHRWTKGLAQTGIKLLPRILRSSAPLGTKLEAWFHLTSPVVYIAILGLSLLAIATLAVPAPPAFFAPLLAPAAAIFCLVFGSVAVTVFFVVAQYAQQRSVLRALAMVLPLMAVGIGISVVNTGAILEALLGVSSPFVRTPKFADGDDAAADPAAKRGRRWRLPPGMVEATLAFLMFGCLLQRPETPLVLVGMPFLILFALGFAAVGFPRLQAWMVAPVSTPGTTPRRLEPAAGKAA